MSVGQESISVAEYKRRLSIAELGGEPKIPGPDATEGKWQAKVQQVFEQNGWKTYHARNPKRDKPGFPDLVAVHPQRGIIFAEIKTKGRKVTPEQDAWISAILEADGRVYVWRLPDDWVDCQFVARGEYYD